MDVEHKYVLIKEITGKDWFNFNELILRGEKGELFFYVNKIFTAKFFKNSSDTTEQIIPVGGWFIVPGKFLSRFLFEERILCPWLYGLDLEEEYYPHALLRQEFPVGCIDFNGHSAAVIVEKNDLCISEYDAKKNEEQSPAREKSVSPEKASNAMISFMWLIIQKTAKEGKIPRLKVQADLETLLNSLAIDNMSFSSFQKRISTGNDEIKPHLEEINRELDEIFSFTPTKTAKK